MRSQPLATMPDQNIEVSIVVPCYNEEAGIEELVRRCCAAASAAAGSDFELILVDDGSTDNTWNVIADQLKKFPQVTAIKLSRNHGHQVALTAGLSGVN